jgi:hypothetical protein
MGQFYQSPGDLPGPVPGIRPEKPTTGGNPPRRAPTVCMGVTDLTCGGVRR